MVKWMCLGGIGIAALAMLLALLDLLTGMPFGGSAYLLADIGILLSGAVLIYLGLNAYKDVK